ncbi:hypothetical protein E3E11_03315 [Oecophyllibacter saccharovorans]|uniref:hypothetical protein n=1 Tax=Oecophyllibacter saccharovorans TaxID=2558360 RepID=UPI001144BD6F|nr:hypothetical protein [Oecophyllibacter saccharovorans]QDH15057.1 hypothetical protein E3E11_03315 [Oecophyllibacter saccharovorans]
MSPGSLNPATPYAFQKVVLSIILVALAASLARLYGALPAMATMLLPLSQYVLTHRERIFNPPAAAMLKLAVMGCALAMAPAVAWSASTSALASTSAASVSIPPSETSLRAIFHGTRTPETGANTVSSAPAKEHEGSRTAPGPGGVFFGIGAQPCSSWSSASTRTVSNGPFQAQRYESWVLGAFSGLQTACLLANDGNVSQCGGNMLKPAALSDKNPSEGDSKLILDSVRLVCTLAPTTSVGNATLTAWSKYARLGSVVSTIHQATGLVDDIARKFSQEMNSLLDDDTPAP